MVSSGFSNGGCGQTPVHTYPSKFYLKFTTRFTVKEINLSNKKGGLCSQRRKYLYNFFLCALRYAPYVTLAINTLGIRLVTNDDMLL